MFGKNSTKVYRELMFNFSFLKNTNQVYIKATIIADIDNYVI